MNTGYAVYKMLADGRWVFEAWSDNLDVARCEFRIAYRSGQGAKLLFRRANELNLIPAARSM